MEFPCISIVILLFVAWHQEFYRVFGEDTPQVELYNGGLISGSVKLSRKGRPFNAFIGIPYANVPERFQESQLITKPKWKGKLNATGSGGSMCPQMKMSFLTLGEHVIGEEDCLNLNIYVPANGTTGNKDYPVMVWIHGGEFMHGDGFSYGPKFLMDEDVILVTINYRLGVFGFLSTGDSVVPGNNGLKDQVNALKWVQENIQKFSGNPKSITVFGDSAGGAAVHYLLLSNITKGLFHRAISQSGSSLSQWAFNPNPKQTAVELATYLKCPTLAAKASEITSEEILKCLKGLPKEELCKAQFKFRHGWPLGLNDFYFAPTTEPAKRVSNLTPFLSEPPISILTRNDSTLAEIPWMVGATEDEGACMYTCVVFSHPELLKEINTDWETIAPLALDYGRYVGREEQKQVSNKLKQFYFGDKEIGNATKQALTNLFSDEIVLYGVYKSAMETASRGNKNSVYLYQYAYKGPTSWMGMLFNVNETDAEKVGHGDEIQHIFDFGQMFPGAEEVVKPGSPDEDFSRNLVRLWTSFAIHGEPKHEWGNSTSTKWEAISKEALDGVHPLRWFRIKEDPIFYDIYAGVKERVQFWDDLWTTHFTPAVMANYKPSTIS